MHKLYIFREEQNQNGEAKLWGGGERDEENYIGDGGAEERKVQNKISGLIPGSPLKSPSPSSETQLVGGQSVMVEIPKG